MAAMQTKAARVEPHAEYSDRLKAQRIRKLSYERKHKQLGIAKLAIALAAILVIVWVVESRGRFAYWFLIPVAAFIVLEFFHAQVLRLLRKCARIIAFYERGMARLESRWMGTGEAGERFQEASHPYSRDLDLFGEGSLFEFLCTARTMAGQEILADWLLGAATVEEIQNRQAAVTELRPRLDLREEMAIFGEDARSTVRPRALTCWAEAAAVVKPTPVRIVATILAALWLGCLAAWAIWGMWELAVISSAVNWMFTVRYSERVRKMVPAEKFGPDLELLAGVLLRLEREEFSAAKLVKLQDALKTEGEPHSIAIRKIKRLVQSLESRRNLLVRVVDPFVLWTAQIALAIENWREKFGPSVRNWLNAVGEMEALLALAGYSFEHPADVFPEFTNEGALFEAEGLAHPLIPEGRAVRNDFRLGGETRLMIISGPNMTGKSTFVRAVGTNAVLAQCGAPVRARRLQMPRLQVTASICILDSLQGGVSHFYAEITRLKLIAELAKGPLAVLFLLDELLNGTNSHDRRIGAEAVLRSLVERGAMGLVTTHDLALTQIAEDRRTQAANFHFEDHLENGELRFDYRLVAGIAKTSNALKLMRSIGLEV
jgi:MutS domain V